jgi:uncharacterized protein (TIGR04255 family)
LQEHPSDLVIWMSKVARSADLPDFERPPINEMYLSTQFEPLAAFRAAHLGLFWERLRPEFPEIDEQAPLPHELEIFGVRQSVRSNVRLELVQRPPIPRYWYVKAHRRHLIQLQNDRFIHNWRKISEEDTYPRYEIIADSFFREFRDLEEFLKVEGIGKISIDPCEITYINHIVAGAGWHTHADAPAVFSFLRKPPLRDPLPEAEDEQCTLRFVMRSGDGGPMGRLIATLTPAFRINDEREFFVFQLTARGRPLSEDKEGIRGFFDLGRVAIVKGFAALTTASMHKIWGRLDHAR